MPNQWTCRRRIIALLDDEPDLQHDKHAVQARIGCSMKTVERSIQVWQAQKRGWAYKAIAESRVCKRCKHRDVCHALDALGLPVLCENVPEEFVEMAAALGLLQVFEGSRVGSIGLGS
jgi:hypothetical protein